VKIGLDIDGVLADFNTAYMKLLKEVSGRDIIPEGYFPSVWNYATEQLKFTQEEDTKVWDVIKSTPFWMSLPVLASEEERGLVHKWDVDHDLYFITTRMGVQVKAQTEAWLMHHFELPCPTVLISAQKGPLAKGLDLDIFVDDRDKNIIEVGLASEKTQCYILDYPYNREALYDQSVKRVSSLMEVQVG
jgi:uncharacterized HAD superfamily protein